MKQTLTVMLGVTIIWGLFIPFAHLRTSSEGSSKNKGMMLIPAGEFTMGTDKVIISGDEKPVHQVYLDAYYIDQFEVTNEQYYRFWQATKSHTPDSFSEEYGVGKWPERARKHPKHPVTGVSWYDAVAYAKWVGKRLPTEAEWEKAARGTDARLLPWGNSFTVIYANIWNGNDGYDNTIAPVGSYKEGASPYGVMDMSGNVWEWTADWYSHGYYYRSPKRNPTGPRKGSWRVIRGGSWLDSATKCLTTFRLCVYPNLKTSFIGFRLAKDVPSSKR
jgi:formylglycine-generating enzyme required for sulfatase activity